MFAIIDLEWTSWKNSYERNWSFSWEKREIIQIGTIKCSKKNKVIKKNIIIKPKFNKNLSLYIQKLTGISQQLINTKGTNLREAILDLNVFFNDVKIIYCNGLDKEIFIENCELYNFVQPNFLKKIINIRPKLSEKLKITENQVISSNLNKNIGLKSLKKHNALDDCLNILNAIDKYNIS